MAQSLIIHSKQNSAGNKGRLCGLSTLIPRECACFLIALLLTFQQESMNVDNLRLADSDRGIFCFVLHNTAVYFSRGMNFV